ncbi:MAG: hypothetical protein JW895_01175 [Thermoleophilaceae bacterium]|nr:hypothetical protein [Thermoleophilaceae bacterium]
MDTTTARAQLAPRVLLAAIAIVAIAWFGVMARNWHLGQDASAKILAEPDMSEAAWDSTMDDFDRAETLDPSTDWSLHKANFLLLRDKAEAAQIAREVARAEPDNLRAWVALRDAVKGRDAAAEREAVIQILRLNPEPRER